MRTTLMFSQLISEGDSENRKDQPGQMGDALPAADPGSGRTAEFLAAGEHHACALLDNDRIKCWGENSEGELGIGDTHNRGEARNEMGDFMPYVDLGTFQSLRPCMRRPS